MTIITKPKKEAEILKTTQKNAKADEIYKSIISKAECCVDHLCGCSSS